MKALILGRGFIGGHLYENLINDATYTNVVCVHRSGQYGLRPILPNGNVILRCNLNDAESVKLLYQHYQPDVIYHCASTHSSRDNFSVVAQNIAIMDNTLATLPCLTRPRLVYLSSATVYAPKPLEYGASETDETSPISPYGVSKLTGESIGKLYFYHKNISSFYALRLCAIVGKGATHGILPDVIRKLKSDSPTLELIGEWPGTCKPYLHINDTIKAIKNFGRLTHGSNLFNICNSDALTSKQVAKLVMKTMNIEKPIVFNGKTWLGDNEQVKLYRDKALYAGWSPVLNNSAEAITRATLDILESQS